MIWLFVFLNFPENTTVTLENRDVLSDLNPNRMGVAQDQTVVVCGPFTLYHFDLTDGKQIQSFGTRGEGPNEYGNIKAAIWTGQHYVISDGRLLRTTVLDSQGHYLFSSHKFYKGFHVKNNRIFAISGDPIQQLIKDQPQTLIELKISDTEIVQVGEKFHKMSKASVDLGYNYTAQYLDSNVHFLFVMEEVNPSIGIYSKSSHQNVRSVQLQLPGFEPGGILPNRFTAVSPNGFSRKDFLRWKFSWSRITGLVVYPTGFVIAYETPCAECVEESVKPNSRVVRLGLDGKIIDQMDIRGYLIGGDETHFYSLLDWDDGTTKDPTYQIIGIKYE